MRRIGKTVCRAALASLMAMAPAAPAAAAQPAESARPARPARPGAAYPRPLSQEWWFTSWEVQTKVWPVSQGEGVTVAVLDTGVQADIPELSGVVLPGTDATGGGGDGRTDTDEELGHGTGMATLIAAQGGSTGFLGVAPKAKILPVTVHSSFQSLGPGIRYAVDHGAKVINISQATYVPCPDDLQQAVSYAIEHDVVIVAGAGNNGDEANPSYSPANCAGVLAIGAIGFSGQRFVPWEKTERQPYVAAGAPGAGVGGVLRDGLFHTSPGGTSQATALTSATVALVRSKYPDMPAREVVQRVIASCRDVDPPGKDDRSGYGLIRPIHALNDNVPKTAPNPVFAAYDRWKAANGGGGGSGGAAGKPAGTPGGRPSASGNRTLVTLLPLLIFLLLVLIAAVIAIVLIAGRRRRGKSPSYGERGRPPLPHGPYGQAPAPAPGPYRPGQTGQPGQRGPGQGPGPYGPPPRQPGPRSPYGPPPS